MNRDPAALVMGLVFVLIAGLGLWTALSPAGWHELGVLLPVALIGIGVLGLRHARH